MGGDVAEPVGLVAVPDQVPQRGGHGLEDGKHPVQLLGQFHALLDAGPDDSSHAGDARVAFGWRPPLAPASRVRVGSMPSRLVTAAAVSPSLPNSRKVALVSTFASVHRDSHHVPAIFAPDGGAREPPLWVAAEDRRGCLRAVRNPAALGLGLMVGKGSFSVIR